MKIRDNPSFKGAYGLTMSHILYFNQKYSRSSHVKVCRDTVMITPIVIYTKKDFFLADEINDKIELFKSAGLIDFWRYQDLEKRIIKDVDARPLFLTLNQLMGSFMIWMLGCFGSSLVFLFELLKFYISFRYKARV